LREILRTLRDRGIPLDARAFARMRSAALWELLVGLKGVGPKTAACVLLFSLGRPYFPVDTHVHRVTRRLGLVPDAADAVKAQQLIQGAVAPKDVYDLHMLLIRHGREVCLARRPLCSRCPLNEICPRVGVVGAR
jgi:endonuclease-3